MRTPNPADKYHVPRYCIPDCKLRGLAGEFFFRRKMQGFYVDDNSCLCIISETHHKKDGESEWHIHRAIHEYDGVDGVIHKQSKCINMTLLNEKVEGIFDGDDCISWKNGVTWRRLKISPQQFYALTHRPYVPFSVVLLYFFYNMAHSACSFLRKRSGQAMNMQ